MKRALGGVIISIMAVSGVLPYAHGADTSEALHIGLDEVIARAVSTSEALKIQESQVDRTLGVYQQTRAGLLPHVTGSAVWTRNMQYPLSAEKTDYSLDSGFSASQVLWSFGRVMYAVDAARKAVAASRYSRDAGKQDIIYAAKLSYYSTILARDTLAITEGSYVNALRNKELMAQRSYGGRSSKYELIRMNAEVASRVPTVNDARTQFDTATESLKKLIDVAQDRSVTLEGEFPETYASFDYACLVAAMNQREPSLKSVRKSVEAAEATVKSSYAGFLPTLSAFASWSRTGGSNDHSLSNFQGLDHYSAAGLKVAIPIWEGGEKEALLRQAKADKDIALLKDKQLSKELLFDLKKAYLEYQQYIGNLAANIEAVTLAEESFHQSQEMFASGQISLTDLNDAELLLTNQRLNKEMTLFNINVTLAKIEKLIAGNYDEQSKAQKS